MNTHEPRPQDYTPAITAEGYIAPIIDERTTLQKIGLAAGKAMMTAGLVGALYSGLQTVESFVQAVDEDNGISNEARLEEFDNVDYGPLKVSGWSTLGSIGALAYAFSKRPKQSDS